LKKKQGSKVKAMAKSAGKRPIAEDFDEGRRVVCFSCSRLSEDIIQLRRSRTGKLPESSFHRCPECGAWVMAQMRRNAG